jgi:LysM repeat protein
MKKPLNLILGCALLLGGAALGQETYTIKPGDNLTKIARNHGCTVAALLKENGLKTNATIHPGQKLKIPGAAAATPSTPADTPATHTVQPGETFSAISRRYNIPVDDLMAANPGISPKTLKPGQKIQLASKNATAKPATPPPVPENTAPATPPEAPANTPAPQPPDAVPGPDTVPEPPVEKPPVVTVEVDAEMTYGEFAAKHGTDIARLNVLNGLDLDSSTVLAKGSALYVPQAAKTEKAEP